MNLPDWIETDLENLMGSHAHEDGPAFVYREFKKGSYYMRFESSKDDSKYHGTMRIEKSAHHLKGSGDLYSRPITEPLKNPLNGVPTFKREHYAAYLQITKLKRYAFILKQVKLFFNRTEYDHLTNQWRVGEALSAKMKWKTAPSDYPNPDDFLQGMVKNGNGETIGVLKMGWVSDFLRTALLEIDAVPNVDIPVDNGGDKDWVNVFEKVGWEMKINISDTSVPAPNPSQVWELSELHEQMLNWRSTDEVWQYHLLCVDRIRGFFFKRGVMYDSESIDSNQIPREGAALASGWSFDPDPNRWGSLSGKLFGSEPTAYFRTAVHELGHAMGLVHPHSSDSKTFMNTTDSLASPNFPNNIEWNFDHKNENRLKHWPDIIIRPGQSPFESHIESDTHSEMETALEFKVEACHKLIPFGAPVRLDLNVENLSDSGVIIPEVLSLKSNFISGYTEDSYGAKRCFKSLIPVDTNPLKELKKGEARKHSFTLLRGSDGWLFPSVGIYKVCINMHWNVEGKSKHCQSTCQLIVNPPQTEEQAEAALAVINSPELMLSFIIGGKHLKEGNKIIEDLMHSKELKHHYQYLEFRKKIDSQNTRTQSSAWKVIDENTVLSYRERQKVRQKYKEFIEGAKPRTKAKSFAKSSKNGILEKNLKGFKKRMKILWES